MTATIRGLLFDRVDRQPAAVLLVELFVGLGWLRAAVSKIVDPAWWSGDTVLAFLASEGTAAVPWYAPAQGLLVREALPLVLVAVLAGQLWAATSLLTGRALASGLSIGMTLNLGFLLGGAVDPSIFYLVLQATVCLWLFEDVADAAASRRLLTVVLALGAALVLASVPFVRSIDPKIVIEDPAAVTATYAAAILAATAAARRRLGPGPAT